MRMKLGVVGMATVIALALLPQLPALGHGTDTASSVSIRYASGDEAFAGTISSTKARCERGRVVTLMKQRRGNDRSLGSATSNRNGNWRIGIADPDGTFYVRVERKVSGSYGHSHVCSGTTSGTIKL